MTAADIYDELSFKNPDALSNKPAPEPWVALMIGSILSMVTVIWWIMRVIALLEAKGLKKETTKKKASTDETIHLLNADVKSLTEEKVEKQPTLLELKSPCDPKAINLLIRVMISAAIDNDLNRFVIVKYCAVSFIFLAGIQLDYSRTLIAMIVLYTVASSLELIRVILGFKSVVNNNDQDQIILSSNVMKKYFQKFMTKDLQPKNVYEDLGRNLFIVIMIFITQLVLISFVCIDILQSDLTSCLDGTKGCPIGGTLGSWCFFIIGIFMALVFQLGPKTNFGESEQNPAYWLRLFLISKNEKTNLTFVNDMKGGKVSKIEFKQRDYRIWLRFIMSFLINGVGFHILVHALPLQIASQSSLIGVVARAVGMMYLVDLDDTPGYKLTIEKKDKTEENEEEKNNDDNVSTIKDAVHETNALLERLKKLVPAEEAEESDKYTQICDKVTYDPIKYEPKKEVEGSNTGTNIDFVNSGFNEECQPDGDVNDSNDNDNE